MAQGILPTYQEVIEERANTEDLKKKLSKKNCRCKRAERI